MVLGMQGLQSQKMDSWACSGSGTFVIPDDSGRIVVSRSKGELGHTMMSGNHFLMGHCSNELKVTVSDGPLEIGESEWGILCQLFVRLTPGQQLGHSGVNQGVGMKWAPPIPNPEASVDPTIAGEVGTTSQMCTGQ